MLCVAGQAVQQAERSARTLVPSGFTLPERPWRHRLTGRVFDHPEFANGTEIVTSSLSLIVRTETADLAYTNTAVYELSAAHSDLIATLLEPD